MPKKIKLNLEDLNVESFKTSKSLSGGAGVHSERWGDCMTEECGSGDIPSHQLSGNGVCNCN